MENNSLIHRVGLLAAGVASSLLCAVPSAHACGGLFCSQTNPVNQAAEQIIFAQNDDGTVTAAIQIMYEGPSESFAWVLPVKGVPTVAVSSELAFQRLKSATDPTYQLNQIFEGNCAFGAGFAGAAGVGGVGGIAVTGGTGGASAPPVVVEAAGTVGPYDWEVIRVVESQEDPAQVALDWLGDNGYDVTALGPMVLRPYLQDGLNLLAFKLTKNASSGSIRPVLITYDGTTPSIPIRPTAVAANDDMGVMVFLLAAHRGIPLNYKGLELNEALINWFNANSNYNAVVSRAADEAEGQGFVTEFAGNAAPFADIVMPSVELEVWDALLNKQYANPGDRLRDLFRYSSWDGFVDALRASVTPPAGVTFEDFLGCLDCYADQATIDEAKLMQSLSDLMIKPMQDTRKLFEDLPYMTRLYSTLSAEEMTVDPVFDINPDLENVSNVHNATQRISCPDADDPFFQVWRVDLPQGDVVRGVDQSSWPVFLDDAPAARRIVQFSTSGAPRIVIDATTQVAEDVEDRNDATMEPVEDRLGPSGTDAGAPTNGDGDDGGSDNDDDGCRVVSPRGFVDTGLLMLGAAGLLLWRRRRS